MSLLSYVAKSGNLTHFRDLKYFIFKYINLLILNILL